MSLHLEKRDHHCDICAKAFTSGDALRRHTRAVHLGVRDGNECELCGKEFHDRSTLNRHRREVHRNKLVKTEIKEEGE